MAEVIERAQVEVQRNANSGAELDALTDRYWEAADADNWGEKLESYLKAEVGAIIRWAAARNAFTRPRPKS